MHRLVLSLIAGFFAQPGATPSFGLIKTAHVAPAVAKAEPVPALPATELASPDRVRLARQSVQHATTSLGRGRVRHRFTFPDGAVVEFTNRPRGRREQAHRARVVAFMGTMSAGEEPQATFEAAGKAAGLSPEAVHALRFISNHEGGFDAINTWDSARFSWGFIQFAGGYGLRPALGLFKSRDTQLFNSLLGAYGVDVTADADGNPVPVYVSATSGRVLRGDAAEQAYGDDPLTIALFIRAGRVDAVKRIQVESAIRNYALPALTEECGGVRLSDVLRSPQGLAMLIDRKVQEGNVGRLERALEQAAATTSALTPGMMPRLERAVLDLVVRDAEARTRVRDLTFAAADQLAGAASGRSSVQQARATLQAAWGEAANGMTAGKRKESLIEGFSDAMSAANSMEMTSGAPRRMAGSLRSAASRLRDLVSGMRFEGNIRDRLKNIRTSSLPGPGL